MKEALAEVGNFKIGGRIINVRFADDKTIIATTREKLQDMVNRLGMAWKGRKYGMKRKEVWHGNQ